MKRNNFRLAVYGLLTLAMMCVIYALSAQNGEESGSLSRWLMETAFGRFLLQILPPLTDSGAALDIRKYAHLTEYAALALFSCLFVLELYCERIPKRSACISVPFCFLYACSDEYHQTFVQGRVGQFADVLFDMAGVIAGVLLAFLIAGLRKENV
jgi:VanZ family protein